MLSKSQISQVVSLHQKKFRKEERLFIAEGEKVVEELLVSSFSVRKIFATEAYIEENQRKSKGNSLIEWIEVKETELKKISLLSTPNQVLALAEIPSHPFDKASLGNNLSLVLDDISDPGNLGTIIRIADWFGIENIICSTDTADCYNPKVVQASMGSLFRVNVHYMELNRFLEENKQSGSSPVFGMILNGENIYSAPLSSEGFIVIGSESNGIRPELEKYFSKALSIPAFDSPLNKPHPDSLNAAVATAIACAEFRRRQN